MREISILACANCFCILALGSNSLLKFRLSTAVKVTICILKPTNMTSTRCAWLLVLCSLLAANLAHALERTVLRIGGTGSAAKTCMNLAEAFQKTRPDIHIKYVPSLGSGGAIKALQAGALEIALSARRLKDKLSGVSRPGLINLRRA